METMDNQEKLTVVEKGTVTTISIVNGDIAFNWGDTITLLQPSLLKSILDFHNQNLHLFGG